MSPVKRRRKKYSFRKEWNRRSPTCFHIEPDQCVPVPLPAPANGACGSCAHVPPAEHSSPWPGRIKASHRVLFQVAISGASAEKTKGPGVFEVQRWRPQDGALKRLQMGLKSPQPHLSKPRSDSHSNIWPGPDPPSTRAPSRHALVNPALLAAVTVHESLTHVIDEMTQSRAMIFDQARISAWIQRCLLP